MTGPVTTGFVKICGLTSADAARHAVDAGADAIGVVFAARSPRNVNADQAREILTAVPSVVTTVLVTADLPVADAIALVRHLDIDVLQLHGKYGAADFEAATAAGIRTWWATSLEHAPGSLVVGARGEEAILLDAPKPGSGEAWDLSALAGRRPDGRWMVAGGLTPANVADAITTVRPWGVDVSSGVESAPGVKDPALVTAFIANARAAFA